MFGCEVDSYFDPSNLGRFEHTPTTVPILERLVAIEGSAGEASVETSPVRPEDLIPEVEAYRLGPGDVIEVRIQDLYRVDAEEILQREIDARGFIDLPLIGSVGLVGLTVDESKVQIARTLEDRNILRDPNVTTQVLQRRGLTFNIIGAIGQPGVYNIPRPDYRLLEALTTAGQFNQGVRTIYVIRQIPLSDKVTRGSANAPRPTAPAMPRPLPVDPATPPSTPPKDNLIDLIDELSKPPAPKPEGAGAAEPEKPRMAMYSSRPQQGGQPPVDIPDDKPPAPKPVLPPPNTTSGNQPVPPANPPAAEPPKPAASAPPAPAPVQPAPMEAAGATAAPSSQPEPAKAGTSPEGLPQSFWIFQDGQWVQVSRARPVAPRPMPTPGDQPVPTPGDAQRLPTMPVPTGPGTAPTPPTPTAPTGPIKLPSPSEAAKVGVEGADQLVTQRVIEVPVGPLLAGSAQYNIIIRPGDVVRVPASDDGLVYVAGEVQRPGPYNLPVAGRLTMLRAINAAGGLNPNAIPERVDLTRMVGPDRQATIRMNLRAIAEGTQPDIFLKSDDMINVGTNFWAFPLAVIRQGFRFSYGFGFVLDRNFQGDVFGPDRASRGF